MTSPDPDDRSPATTAAPRRRALRRGRLLPAGLAVVVAAAGPVAAGCGGDDGGDRASTGPTPTGTPSTAVPVVDPGDGGRYDPTVDPADFVEGVDHPFLPLPPGSRWVYEGSEGGETERVEVVVTGDRREVMGIPVVVVRDTVTVDGELAEDTFDWFAQDREGNVWYMGEDSTEYEDGEPASSEGSWEAGVDGALPGIVMPADPQVGDAFRQELYPGEAEDMAEILAVDSTARVPFGRFDELLVTEDWNPLEPEVVEEKSYARGIGLVLEVHTAGGEGRVELIEHTPGG
jgi:hypothetical protein